MFNWSQKLTVGGKRKEKTNFVQEIDSWEKKKKTILFRKSNKKFKSLFSK